LALTPNVPLEKLDRDTLNRSCFPNEQQTECFDRKVAQLLSNSSIPKVDIKDSYIWGIRFKPLKGVGAR